MMIYKLFRRFFFGEHFDPDPKWRDYPLTTGNPAFFTKTWRHGDDREVLEYISNINYGFVLTHRIERDRWCGKCGKYKRGFLCFCNMTTVSA